MERQKSLYMPLFLLYFEAAQRCGINEEKYIRKLLTLFNNTKLIKEIQVKNIIL
jgi:hypothetical protein